MGRRFLSGLLAVALVAGGVPLGAAPTAPSMETRHLPSSDTAVGPVLIGMMDERRPPKPTALDFSNTALFDLVRLTTPQGYRLKTRFIEPRVPLVQALAFSVDPQLHERLLEAARWSNTPRARGEGLLGIAAERNIDHLKYFKEALLDQDLNIQFAAVEALQVWGRPEAKEYLADAARPG